MQKVLFSFLLIIIFFVSKSWSDDEYSKYKIYGFSQNGQYLAFERVGSGDDGIGPFVYLDFFVVDVPQNRYPTKPLQKLLREIQPKTNQSLDKTLNNIFKKEINEIAEKYQISSKYLGEKINFIETIYLEKENKIIAGFKYKTKDYKVILEQYETDIECLSNKAKIFCLALSDGKTKKILQEDKKLPKSRGCAFDYKITEAYTYNNYIAIFLAFKTPGYEGNEVRQIIVTGELM